MKKKELEALVLEMSEDLAILEKDFFNFKQELKTPNNKKNVKYFEIRCDNIDMSEVTLRNAIIHYYRNGVIPVNLNVKEK